MTKDIQCSARLAGRETFGTERPRGERRAAPEGEACVMADRSSAALFAKLFKIAAGEATLDAEQLWEATRDYDFSPYQMYCDDALIKLGLAEKCKHGRVFYRGESAVEECDDCFAAVQETGV